MFIMEKIRKSNFELLRIVCMLFIVGGHLCLKHDTPFGLSDFDWLSELGLRGFFVVAVNVFILISGYFSIRFRGQRIVRLDLQTLFYSVAIMVLTIAVGWHTLDFRKDVLMLLPILTKRYWFITCYVMLYVIAPYLNRWVESASVGFYRRVLVFGFLVIYVWPTFCFMVNAGQFIDDAGYGIISFIYLYIFGRYLRLHYVDKHGARFYFCLYLLAGVLLFLVQYGLSSVLHLEFTSFYSYNTLFVFVACVSLFLAFSHLDFRSRVINMLAAPCFSVYLIHSHPYFWGSFCSKLDIAAIHGWRWVMAIFVGSIAIYLACFVIDRFRVLLLGRLEARLAERIGSRLDRWVQ